MNLAKSTPSYVEFGDEEIRDIIIRSYSIIGEMSGIGQSTIQVEAREAIVPERNMADYSVRLELNTGGDYPQQAVAVIGTNDADRFISMLRKLETTTISTDRFSFSEVQYEINDLSVIVFNNDRGSLMVAVTCNGVTIHLTSVSKIAHLIQLVERAKSHLDQHRRM